jgi:putative inorganic carbon (HCO3(-)) transporter
VPSTSLTIDRHVVASAVVLTCVLFTAQAADPVNVIKLTALMLSALVLVSTTIYRVMRYRVAQVPLGPPSWAVVALLGGFLASAAAAPTVHTALYGAYGRNSGLLAYLSALVLFVAALRVLGRPHTGVLIGAVVLAGMFTASYGLLQRLGIDAVAWNNPFNPIIAALGNPNFASGYLGIAAAVAAGGALWAGWTRGWRIASAATAALCLLTAALSDSVQGPIAAGAGLLVVALTFTLDRTPRLRWCGMAGLGTVCGVAIVVLLLGALAKAGPAARIFSDAGSEARTHYWAAALQMFRDRPVLGVGLDHYGSFWRSTRSPESVADLTSSNFSDAAHSVPLHVLAQGGVVLGLAYLAFLVVVLTALVQGLRRLRGDDRMLLGAVGGGWTAYQVQSFVSIDQVPLLVLHFTLAGAVIAAAGAVRFRELRLPGAPQPDKLGPKDARTRRRIPKPIPARTLSTGDRLTLGVAGLLLAALAWNALTPLRANAAMADGDHLFAEGNGNAALDAYKRAAHLMPGQPIYWMRQGSLYSQVQQPARARGAYAEAVARDRYEANALRLAASLAEQEQDLTAAREHFERLVELDPLGSESLLAAAQFELRHGGAEKARQLLEPVVRALPDEAALWATLGDARAVLGDTQLARDAYERALALQPRHATATDGLAKLGM